MHAWAHRLPALPFTPPLTLNTGGANWGAQVYKLGRIAFQTLVMEMPHGGKADLKLWRPAFEAVLGLY